MGHVTRVLTSDWLSGHRGVRPARPAAVDAAVPRQAEVPARRDGRGAAPPRGGRGHLATCRAGQPRLRYVVPFSYRHIGI